MTDHSRGAGLVVIFGESINDTRSIRVLVRALRPDFQSGDLRPLKSPPSLVKNLDVAKKRTRASKLAAVVRALAAAQKVRAAIFHEDADAVEPAHSDGERQIREAYKNLPCPVVACVPAWELETWWFLFPEETASVQQRWQIPNKYRNKDVGKVRSAKEELRRCLRPSGVKSGQRFPDYEEEHSPEIAEKIHVAGCVRAPKARSASWSSFVEQVDAI